jgi:hypothetical protein
MSVKDKVIKVRYCDKCQKEITGKLKTMVCPGCGDEFCYDCIRKTNKPKVEKPKRGRKERSDKGTRVGLPETIAKPQGLIDTPTEEKTSITLRGVTWEGKTRQEAVDGFYKEKDSATTPEEQGMIEEYLAGK